MKNTVKTFKFIDCIVQSILIAASLLLIIIGGLTRIDFNNLLNFNALKVGFWRVGGFQVFQHLKSKEIQST